MIIVRYERGKYTDQYGFEHDCRFIIDKLEVTKTDQYIRWDYYEPIKDYIWITADGRKFRYHTQTDFGPCDMPFELLGTKEQINYYAYREKAKSFGMYPIIDDPSKYKPSI